MTLHGLWLWIQAALRIHPTHLIDNIIILYSSQQHIYTLPITTTLPVLIFSGSVGILCEDDG